MLVFYARNIYFPQREHGKGTSKRGKKNMLRLSPFEVEYEDIQINNHAIAPTVLKQNVRRQRMPERNLLMKFRLNTPLGF